MATLVTEKFENGMHLISKVEVAGTPAQILKLWKAEFRILKAQKRFDASTATNTPAKQIAQFWEGKNSVRIKIVK